MTFGIPFSINFLDRLNLLLCNKYNAKTSFLFWHQKSIKKSCLFNPSFWTSFFLFFFSFFIKCSIWRTASKSNGLQKGIKNRASTTKTSKIEIVTCPKTRSWNNLAPEPPREAPWVRLFRIFEECWILSGPVLNDLQCLLASPLVLNSGIHPKR